MALADQLRLAPKSEQPAGGFKHPRHLLAHGPKHLAWSALAGWYETNEYCVSPSCSFYNKALLNGPS